MSLLASHYFEPWIIPPGLNLLLVISGFGLYFFSKRSGLLMMFLGVMSLWLLSMPIIAYPFVNLLQYQYDPLKENNLAIMKPQAILVLGGGTAFKPEYNNQYTLSAYTQERVAYAVYLHNITHLPIILSGGKDSPYYPSEAQLMKNDLKENYHISPLFLEEQSLNTAEESKFIANLLKEYKISSVYLVTNAWHMPRSIFIFHCAGIEVMPAPMGYFEYGPGYSFLSLLPNMSALMTSSIAIHEFVGLAWYSLKYNNQCAA